MAATAASIKSLRAKRTELADEVARLFDDFPLGSNKQLKNALVPLRVRRTSNCGAGGFAPKLVATADNLVRLPEEVSSELGAMATDAGLTAYHAMMAVGGAKAGVVGLGGLGGLGYIGHR